MAGGTRVHATAPTPALHVFLPQCSHGTLGAVHQSPAGRRPSCPLDHGVLKSQGSGHLGPQHLALFHDHKLLSINEENEAQEVLGESPKGPTRRDTAGLLPEPMTQPSSLFLLLTIVKIIL